MAGCSDSNRSDGKPEPARATGERSLKRKPDRRNTNRQRGSMRATSVRGNAKSERHRKTHRVEPGGAGGKFMHLTWGDPGPARGREVSRGRSSADARRKAGGAKGRRTTKARSTNDRRRQRGRIATSGQTGVSGSIERCSHSQVGLFVRKKERCRARGRARRSRATP